MLACPVLQKKEFNHPANKMQPPMSMLVFRQYLDESTRLCSTGKRTGRIT